MSGQFHAPSHPGVFKKKSKYEWEYTSDIFYSLEFLRVPIIMCVCIKSEMIY